MAERRKIQDVAKDIEYLIKNNATDDNISNFIKSEKYDPKKFSQLYKATANPKRALYDLLDVDTTIEKYGFPKNEVTRHIVDSISQFAGAFVNQYGLEAPQALARKAGAELGDPKTVSGKVGELSGGLAGNIMGAPQKIFKAGLKGVQIGGKQVIRGIGAQTGLTKKLIRGGLTGGVEGAVRTPKTEEGNIIKGTLQQRGLQAGLHAALGAPTGVFFGVMKDVKTGYRTIEAMPGKPAAGVTKLGIDQQEAVIKNTLKEISDTSTENLHRLDSELINITESGIPKVKQAVKNWVVANGKSYSFAQDRIIETARTRGVKITLGEVQKMIDDVSPKLRLLGQSDSKAVKIVTDLEETIAHAIGKRPFKTMDLGTLLKKYGEASDILGIRGLREASDEVPIGNFVKAFRELTAKAPYGKQMQQADMPLYELNKAFRNLLAKKDPAFAKLNKMYGEYANIRDYAIDAFDIYGSKFATKQPVTFLQKASLSKGGKGIDEFFTALERPTAFARGIKDPSIRRAREVGQEILEQRGKLDVVKKEASGKLFKLSQNRKYMEAQQEFQNRIRREVGLTLANRALVVSGYYLAGKYAGRKMSGGGGR